MARTLTELLRDADRILSNPDFAALGTNLRTARTALPAENLDALAWDDPRVGGLMAALEPFGLSGRRIPRKMTYLLVALSILTMYFVACTTIVHNKGVALLADIEKLAATEPQRRFSLLERQLADSLSSDIAAGKPFISEHSHIVLNELRGLDASIKHLSLRIYETDGEIYYPAPGMATLVRMISAPFSVMTAGGAPSLTVQRGDTQSTPCGDLQRGPPVIAGVAHNTSGSPNLAANPFLVADAGNPAGLIATQSAPIASVATAGQSSAPDHSKIATSMLRQACEVGLWHVSRSIPSIDEWVTRLRQSTSNYSLWLLPGIYAALGSLIFFMRQVLDDSKVNPEFHRVVHRIAMAGMAGIVVGWVWNPNAAGSAELRSIGASLFVASFVVGYSIDVFFTALDKLVTKTTEALSNSVDPKPKPATAGAAANPSPNPNPNPG